MVTDGKAQPDFSTYHGRLARPRAFLLAALSLILVPTCVSAIEFTLMPSPHTVHIGHFNAAS
jgi:hypothetical protein